MINPLLQWRSAFDRVDSKIKPLPIIGFDTEDDTKGTPLSFVFYGDDGPFYTTSVQEAIDYIYNVKTPSIFVAHNLEYDIGNLFTASDFQEIVDMVYASDLLKVTLVGTQHFFINSSSFFKGSLKLMGENIGLEKLEGNALSKEYAVRDAEIVYRFMKQFQEKVNREMSINMGITIGQLAMQTFRRNYMQGKKQVTYNSPNCLKAYYGGRVEVFYKGILKNIKVVDINSCYPYVMGNFPYPDTSKIEPSMLATHEYGIGKFKVSVPKDCFLPPLPHRSPGSGRLFFPTGIFTGWWTYAEVRNAIAHGVTALEEYEGEGTNAAVSPFTDFINDFYAKRMKAREEKNDFEVLFYKLFSNNLYGKWCQHLPSTIMTRDRMHPNKLDRMGKWEESRKGPFYQYRIDRQEPARTANYMWGIYVTSYARIHLYKAMQAVHNGVDPGLKPGSTLIYCDTDSIMYNGQAELSISKKLGDWSEEKYDLGVFRNAKGYLLCDQARNGARRGAKTCARSPEYEIQKVACKGVPTDYAYDFIVKGAARGFKRPIRLREGLVRMNAAANKDKSSKFLKEIGINYWNKVEKEMLSLYVKRTAGPGVTYPLDVQDIPKAEADCVAPGASIENELKKKNIRVRRQKRKKYFENIKVPKDWFKKTGLAGAQSSEPGKGTDAGKEFYLKASQAEGLAPGTVWFEGDCTGLETGKYGDLYNLAVRIFKGKGTSVILRAKLPAYIIDRYGIADEIVGKKITCKIGKKIEGKKYLNLSLELSDLEDYIKTDAENLDWNLLDDFANNFSLSAPSAKN